MRVVVHPKLQTVITHCLRHRPLVVKRHHDYDRQLLGKKAFAWGLAYGGLDHYSHDREHHSHIVPEW